MANPKLQAYLAKIQKLFNTNQLINQHFDTDSVAEYYSQSNIGYEWFHSRQGAVHMALNYDGQFSQDGYYEQARLAEGYIQQTGASQVLEIASGKGFNSIFLAKRNPTVNFIGMDLTPVHIAIANKRVKLEQISNVRFTPGDFHNLAFPNESFDYVFEIESICHAMDMPQVLHSIGRVLKSGGLFTVIDGFRKRDVNSVSSDERTAAILVEKSMAVGNAYVLKNFLACAESTGFAVVDVRDLSEAIIPNLKRIQLLARGFFKFPLLARIAYRRLPPYLVKNSIAGLLMPIMVTDGIQGYFMITLRK